MQEYTRDIINESSLIIDFNEPFFKLHRNRIKRFLYKKKQYIFREGFNAAGLFIVSTGKVKMFKTAHNGKEVIVSIIGENEIFGHQFLISKTEYDLSACATEDTEVRFIPKRLFFEYVKHNPDFMFKLMALVSSEYSRVLNKLVDVATKQVRKRVAEMLIRLKKNHGVEHDTKTLNIVLSRDDLAHLVATNTETLVRTLAEFKKDNMIAFKGKKILIIDMKKLISTAKLY